MQKFDKVGSKILRTIIGLSLILMIWPVFIISIPVGLLLLWVVFGELDGYAKSFSQDMILAPYNFVKKVWEIE